MVMHLDRELTYSCQQKPDCSTCYCQKWRNELTTKQHDLVKIEQPARCQADVRQWGRATAELLGAMLFGTAVAADSTGILGHGPSMGLAAAELLVTTQLGDTNCKPVNGAGTSTSRRTKAHMD